MSIKDTVGQLYADYEQRNLQNVLDALPEDFCFEWPLDENLARWSGTCHCKNEFLAQLEDLANNFEFNSYAATNILIDGNRAAAQVDSNLTSKKTGDTFDVTIAHFWTFHEGRPVKLVEYMDSALMKHQSK